MPFLFRRLKPSPEKSIEIINKYYDVDRESKTVHLPLNYDASDVLYEQKYGMKRTFFNDNALCEDIASVMRGVPREYAAEAEVRLDESIPLSAEEIGDSLTDALVLNVQSAARAFRAKNLTACMLVIVGSTLLWFSFWATTLKAGAYTDIVSFLYNNILILCSQAMIWEFIDLLLPTPQSEMSVAELVLRRTRKITLEDSRGGSFSVRVPSLISACPDFSKRFALLSQVFLLASLVLFNHGAAALARTIDIMRGRLPLEAGFGGLYLATDFACDLVSLITPIAGCICYTKRNRKTTRAFIACLVTLIFLLLAFNLQDYVIPLIQSPSYVAQLNVTDPGTVLVDAVNLFVHVFYIVVSILFMNRVTREDV